MKKQDVWPEWRKAMRLFEEGKSNSCPVVVGENLYYIPFNKARYESDD